MRKAFAAVFAALVVIVGALAPRATLGDDRVTVYPNQNPSSVEVNQQARNERLALGNWMRDALASAGVAGTYNDLSIVPGTGTNVVVQPSTSGTLGTFYQLIADDASPLPVGFTPQLGADSTPIVVQAFQSGPASALSVPAPASLSVYYLIEAQIQPLDTGTQSLPFVSAAGQRTYQSVATDRTDTIAYAVKASAVGAPSAPSPDAGWTGIGTVLVPASATSISSGEITMLPGFSGFTVGGVHLSPATPDAGSVSVSGSVSGSQLVSTVATGTAPLQVNSTTLVPNLTAALAGGIAGVLPTSQGGTGTASPSGLTAVGTNPLTVSGTFPNQVITMATSPAFGTTTVAGLTIQGLGGSGCLKVNGSGVVSQSSCTSTLSAGTDLSITGGVISVVPTPTFTGASFGTPGTADSCALLIANASTNSGSTQQTCFGAGGYTIDTIAGKALSIGDNGYGSLATLDLQGNWAIVGKSYQASLAIATSGTTYASFDASGNLTAASVTVPSLAANGCVSTNGSSKLTASTNPCVTSVSGGSNVVIGGTGTAPSVAVTAAPSFTSVGLGTYYQESSPSSGAASLGFAGTHTGTISFYTNGLSNAATASLNSSGALTVAGLTLGSSSGCVTSTGGVIGIIGSSTCVTSVGAGTSGNMVIGGTANAPTVDITSAPTFTGTATIGALAFSTYANVNVTASTIQSGFAGTGAGTISWFSNGLSNAATMSLTSAGALSVASLTASGLTAGNCLQATTGGLLATVSQPCGTVTGLTATTNISVGTGTTPSVTLSTTPTVAGIYQTSNTMGSGFLRYGTLGTQSTGVIVFGNGHAASTSYTSIGATGGTLLGQPCDELTIGLTGTLNACISGGGVLAFNGSGIFAGGVQPNSNTGGYTPELDIGGAVSTTHPKIVDGSVAASTSGVAATFGSSFAFANTSYQCTLGTQGTTPIAVSYVNTSTTSITVYSASGTPTVSYHCTGH